MKTISIISLLVLSMVSCTKTKTSTEFLSTGEVNTLTGNIEGAPNYVLNIPTSLCADGIDQSTGIAPYYKVSPSSSWQYLKEIGPAPYAKWDLDGKQVTFYGVSVGALYKVDVYCNL